jgi:hypothetical protein
VGSVELGHPNFVPPPSEMNKTVVTGAVGVDVKIDA